jgi:hypothetical protein
MKRIIKQSALQLAPTVLAAAALLACNDGPTTRAQTNSTQPAIESPVSPTTTQCWGLGSADAFVPGSRHMPKC